MSTRRPKEHVNPPFPYSHIPKTLLTLTSVILPASPPLRTTTMVWVLPFLSRGGERAISTSFLLLLLRLLVLLVLVVLPPPVSASTSGFIDAEGGPVKAMLCLV